MLFVLIYLGCHNKIPQTGQLQQHNCLWQFWSLEVQVQGFGMNGCFWGFSLWPADGHLFPPGLSSGLIHPWCLFSYKDTSHNVLGSTSMTLFSLNYCSKIFNFKCSHLAGGAEVKISTWIFERHNSVHSTLLICFNTVLHKSLISCKQRHQLTFYPILWYVWSALLTESWFIVQYYKNNIFHLDKSKADIFIAIIKDLGFLSFGLSPVI